MKYIISLASNVSLILATAPVLTAILAHFFTKGKQLNKNLIIGFLIIITGAFLVIFTGNFVLKLTPVADILQLSAALCWAVYSICTKKFTNSTITGSIILS